MKTSRVTKHRTEIHFNHLDLIDKLLSGVEIKGQTGKIEFIYRVPGGGDWSSMDAPINKEHPITCVIESTEEVES